MQVALVQVEALVHLALAQAHLQAALVLALAQAQLVAPALVSPALVALVQAVQSLLALATCIDVCQPRPCPKARFLLYCQCHTSL